jgi:hypothetical protein
MKTSSVNPSNQCPYCQHKLELATASPRNRHATPKPNDVTVCIECASVLVFTDDLNVRAPNIVELTSAMKHVGVAEIVAAVKARRRNQ